MVNFIKKTIVIQAVKVAEILRQWDCKDTDLPHWVLAGIEADGPELYRDGPSLMVQCSTGENTAPSDGWIIQGVDGEIYPCPADVFAASYEPYDPEATETEGLSFSQALSALCSSRKVARKEWSVKRYVEHADGCMYFDGMVDVDRIEASLNGHDVLAMDWYIVTD